MKKKICIMGAGGAAKDVLNLINDLDKYEEVDCFMVLDEVWEREWKNKQIMEKPVKPQSDFNSTIHCATIGIGETSIREKITQKLPKNTEYISLIHPTAVISKWAKIGKGAIICAGCIITCDVNIGKHAYLNIHTTISHDNLIGDFVTTSPGTNISGNCKIGNKVYFGTSSAVRQGIQICDNTFIGMGAIVVKDIATSGTYVGVPAKRIK